MVLDALKNEEDVDEKHSGRRKKNWEENFSERESFEKAISMQCYAAMVLRSLYDLSLNYMVEFSKTMPELRSKDGKDNGRHITNFRALERGAEVSRVILKEVYTRATGVNSSILIIMGARGAEYYLEHGYEMLGKEWFTRLCKAKKQLKNKNLDQCYNEYVVWTKRLAVMIGTAKEYNLKLGQLVENMDNIEGYSENGTGREDLNKFKYSISKYVERKYGITQAAMGNFWKVFVQCADAREKKKREIIKLLNTKKA